MAVIDDVPSKPAGGAAPPRPEAPRPEPKPPASTETGEGEASERVRSSPLVRRIAKEHGIDLASLSSKGTGIQGRITKADILSHLEQGGVREAAPERKGERPAAPGAPAAPHPVTSMGGVERVPMTA